MTTFDLGPDPEVIGGGGLGVQIPHQGAIACFRGQIGEIDGGGGLPYPTLDAVDADDLQAR